LPSVGTIMSISGGLRPGIRNQEGTRSTTFARCGTSVWKEELKKQGGPTFRSPSQNRT
jgi:hypothetical protein